MLALAQAAMAIVVTALSQQQSPAPQPSRVTLPTVTVTAQKEPANAQELPVSVTTVLPETLADDGITSVGQAAIYAPNTYFTEFSARKLSESRFRGIGSSPANPGITTYIDGVPQLNTNSSSIEFLDVSQVEFVRGPQSALFGRNTLGGLVNISSTRPSTTVWTGGATIPIGNFNSVDLRADASGPIGSKAALGVAFGHTRRDGFTKNDVTGHDLDSRGATFGKAQLLLTPTADWDARVILTGERARDGDYALEDLATLRATPFHASRDFEGHTWRDVTAATILTNHRGSKVNLSTITGFVHWKTDDLTDLDYTPLPLITRSNDEKDFQFTQEVRLASTPGGAVTVFDGGKLTWQTGVFVFRQNYDQDAANTFAPFVLSPFVSVPVSEHSPIAALNDFGLGVYGQGTVTLKDGIDVTAGARLDRENKKADLTTSFSPQIAPTSVVNGNTTYSDVSPQFSVAYHIRPDAMSYVSVGRGFKAGGFNPASPAGQEAYGEEHAWHLDAGVKNTWAARRVTTDVAVFYINWSELQLNLPNPASPGQFFIANVGGATSRGVEAELNARAREGVDLFASVGYTHARFAAGTTSSGADVSGKILPNTPDYTATVGAELSHPMGSGVRMYGRAEAVFYGAFQYDEANTAGQSAYALTNLRAGVRRKTVSGELWIRNAFDTHYIPVAFAYSPFAQSGFIGENGAPRTFGVTLAVKF